MNPPTEILEDCIKRDTTFARHTFTADEKLTLSADLVGAIDKLSGIESEFESCKTEFKGRISKAELERDAITAKLRDGFELRQTPCIIVFNHPSKGRKAFYRETVDGGVGDFVREEAMTQADFHRPLFKEDEKETAVPNNEDLTKSFDSADRPEGSTQNPPAHLPEAHEKAPGVTCTVSIDGGPEIPMDVSDGFNLVKKLAKKAREPYTQPPGTVDVNGAEEHWLVIEGLDEPTTQIGLVNLLRPAAKRALWKDPSIAFVIEKMAEHKDVTSKRAVIAAYCFTHQEEVPAAE